MAFWSTVWGAILACLGQNPEYLPVPQSITHEKSPNPISPSVPANYIDQFFINPDPDPDPDHIPRPSSRSRPFPPCTYNRIFMQILSDPTPSSKDVLWRAQMEVHARDIDTVMKKGLYWSEDNWNRSTARIFLDESSISPFYKHHGMIGMRYYYLTDLSDTVEWSAQIWVYSSSISTLANFRLSVLGPENILRAAATNSSGDVIYHYHRHPRGVKFNIIYDDMPLTGYWPWPKETAPAHQDGQAEPNIQDSIYMAS